VADDYISPEQVKEGFKKCHVVVNRLLKDAELLMKNGRYSSSISLAILAYEEVSKANDLRLKITDEEGLTKQQWTRMSFGRIAHDIKLSSMVDRKEERLSQFNEREENFMNFVNDKLGLPSTDLIETRTQTLMMKHVFPKLNVVKQDCFYLNWNEGGSDWTYFDRKFNDKIKKAIAKFLITITETIMVSQKFTIEIPSKPFIQYSDKEWEKVRNLKSCIDLKKIQKYSASPEFAAICDRAIVAIDSYPEKKKK